MLKFNLMSENSPILYRWGMNRFFICSAMNIFASIGYNISILDLSN